MPRAGILIICLLGSLQSHAKSASREPQQVGGDIGMRYIDAATMNIEKANTGSSISFQGEQAKSLLAVLPKSLIVDDPEDSVGFVVRGDRNLVIVKCIKNRYSQSRKKYVPVEDGPQCSVRVESNDDAKSESWSSSLKWTNQPDK